jgi:hypothetical protein
MIENRLGLDPSRTQSLTTVLLSIQGLLSVVSAPVIAHYADKMKKRKNPLLVSIVGCAVGTVLIALTPSSKPLLSSYHAYSWLILRCPVSVLFIGRVIQSIAGSGTWIIGFATLTDNIDQQHMGKVVGMVTSFIASGVIAGPVISGTVLEMWGYWQAWSIPIGLLALDFIARLLLIEKKTYSGVESDTDRFQEGNDGKSTPNLDETTGLLSPPGNEYAHEQDKPSVTLGTHSSSGFYKVMLTDISVLTGLFNNWAFSIILSGFDTTLPIHCRSAFGWGTFYVSMALLALQLPALILNPVVGWLRDCVGLPYPTAGGWLILAPLLWLLGSSQLDGFIPNTIVLPLFMATVLSIGIVSAFIRGADTIQLVCKCDEFSLWTQCI